MIGIDERRRANLKATGAGGRKVRDENCRWSPSGNRRGAGMTSRSL
jgi:hypothetical protein